MDEISNKKLLARLLEYAKDTKQGNRGTGYVQGVEDCIAVIKDGSIARVKRRDDEIKRQRAEGRRTKTKGLR